MSSSKVIEKGELSAYQRWELPAVEGQLGSPPLVTARQLELVAKKAHDDGFAQGRREGYAAGEAELAERAGALTRLADGLAAALEEFDHAMEESLVDLAVALARQIIRREMKLDRSHIVGLVREALAQLAPGPREATIHLHPEDAALVREHLAPLATLRIVEDPVLERGDCRVQSDTARIDAGLDARLAALAVAALGGERRDDERRA